MRGLFFKIFIIFWIAQSLIFVISTALILSHRFPGREGMFDPAVNGLRAESHAAVQAFEAGGCAGLKKFADGDGYPVALEDASGKRVCSAPAIPATAVGITPVSQVSGQKYGGGYIWTIPVTAANGKEFLYRVMVVQRQHHHTWYGDLLHFAFPQLPVAIAVGGLTTFVLVLIFTRPVVRLRKAARELATGKLSTRVEAESSARGAVGGDEFHGLMHDFNHMAERLESLVSAQRLLLRDVSHELRSPLARLSVALELSRADADQRMTTHLDRIERETVRLNQLIGQLLTLSSMEALEGQDNFARFSLKTLLEEMIPDATYEAQQRQCLVTLQAACECEVLGKRELLYRAIENVVRNAIRYTGEGTEVNIRLYPEQDGRQRVAIVEVSDFGPGIPEAEMQAIFRPFYRVDPARSVETGGFGVGLAIADRVVRLHRGQLRAWNRNGGGATLQIRLPLA